MEFGFYTELFILIYRCRAGAALLIPLDTRMQGNSYQGPLPPFSPKEQTLRADLQRHVEELSGRTGERNMYRWDALQAAARYLETEFQAAGLTALSETYRTDGKSVRNLVATILGTTQPDEIVLVGTYYDFIWRSPAWTGQITGRSGRNPAALIGFFKFVSELRHQINGVMPFFMAVV